MSGDSHPSVAAFTDIVSGPLQTYLTLSSTIGGEVKEHAALVQDAFRAQHAFLIIAASSPQPAQNTLIDLLRPTSDKIQGIQSYRESRRSSKVFNHLSAISEAIPALGWVTVSPTPAPYIKELSDAGQFYTNRVLVEYKDKDKNHVEWSKAWIQTLSELHQMVKRIHTTGLVWNAKGIPVVAGGAPPPPPPGPPPPMPDFGDLSLGSDPLADNRAALFASINQGQGVTSGLRKVTADQMTHKNPELRGHSAVPASSAASNSLPGGVKSPLSQAKPPKFELQGKKWVVEFFRGRRDLVINETEMNQVVYIYACQDTTLQIKGKINSIVMDACKKCSLVFDDIVSSVEFINCQSIQMQAMGKVPTVTIDKTDGAQVFLSEAHARDTEVVTSKASEVNVMILKPDGDYAEFPVPEQLKSRFTGKGLATEVVEQKG